MDDHTPIEKVPLPARVASTLARRLPYTWMKMLSRSPARRFVDAMLKDRPGGPQWVTIVGGLNKGRLFLLDLRLDYAYWLGFHEPEVQQLLPRVLRLGQVVYDVGANIGLMSVAMATLVGPSGKVFAFEPVSTNAQTLEAVVTANGLPMITVIRRAIADTIGLEVMQEHIDALGGSMQRGGRTVPVTTLDAFVFEEGFPTPAFVKIDVEGAECRVLSGMRRLVASHRPLLLIEIHAGQATPVRDWLLGHGYETLAYVRHSWRQVAAPFEGRCFARPLPAPQTGTQQESHPFELT